MVVGTKEMLSTDLLAELMEKIRTTQENIKKGKFLALGTRESLQGIFNSLREAGGIEKIIVQVDPRIPLTHSLLKPRMELLKSIPRGSEEGTFQIEVETPYPPKKFTGDLSRSAVAGTALLFGPSTTIMIEEIGDGGDLILEFTPGGKGEGRTTYNIPVEWVTKIEKGI